MNINGFDLTEDVAKEIKQHVSEVMEEFDALCYKLTSHGGHELKRNFRDRLRELGLWDCNALTEEYTKIKARTSTLPRTLRDAVSTVFEAGIAKYIVKHQNKKENEVQ